MANRSNGQKHWNLTSLDEWWVLAIALCVAIGLWLAWSWEGASLAHRLVAHRPAVEAAAAAAKAPSASAAAPPGVAELGQAGDSFGGANALFAAIAGALVFWAGFVQAKSLKEARDEYSDERRATSAATGAVRGTVLSAARERLAVPS